MEQGRRGLKTRPAMERRRLLVAWVAVGGIVALTAGVLALSVAGERSSPEASAAVNADFTYFDGSTGSFADFRGTPLVVNFWASWCPPCVAEMPGFEQVHQRLREQVAFLGLNMQEIDRATADRLVAQTGVTYHLGEDPDGAIFQDFGGIAMPTTLFIDGDGRLVEIHAGALFADHLEAKIQSVLLEG